jgi:hypothetical protein
MKTFGIDDIGVIDFTRGYKICVNDSLFLTVCDTVLDASTKIELPAGWSMVSYIPTFPLDAADALRSIEEVLVLAKDNDGKTYIPVYGINDLDLMHPGQGYQLYLESEATLVYPANRE